MGFCLGGAVYSAALHKNQRTWCICTDQVREARNFHDKYPATWEEMPNTAQQTSFDETPMNAVNC